MSAPKICLNKGKLFLFRAKLSRKKRASNNKQVSSKENFDADTISQNVENCDCVAGIRLTPPAPLAFSPLSAPFLPGRAPARNANCLGAQL